MDNNSFEVYQTMYLKLFNAVTDAVSHIENRNYGFALQLLKEAQAKCEEIYIG